MVYFWRCMLFTIGISSIHCVENKRLNKIEKTQHILAPNVGDNIKVQSLSKEVAKRNTLNYADVPKSIAEDILRRLANLTISVKLNTGNNDTLVNFPSNQLLNNDDKVIEPLLPTLDYSELKPKIFRTNIKPTYETRVNKLQLKYPDEAMRSAQNNFTGSVVINKNNDTIHNNKPGFKLKVKISKKDDDDYNIKDNDNMPTQYAIANNNNKHTTKNLYPDIKGEKKNDTENFPKRTVPGFNIENKSDVHFKANTEHTIENENVRFLPMQYHVPVLRQFQINQAPLPPPILPPRRTLPKFIPVYQSDYLPLHFHAPDPVYSSHLDTISQGISPQNQFHNLEKYLKLHDSNQHSELKGLEKGVFDGENVNSYIYEQYGIPIPKGNSVVEPQVKVNRIKNRYTDIGSTRRGIVNKNEEYLDALIKIPKNVVEHYQPQIIETVKYNIDNNTIKDFISLFSQVQGNVSYRKSEDLKAKKDLHVTNSTDTFGLDTLIKQYITNPMLVKEQTENVFPKLISSLGPEFSTYFGDNPIPASKIENEIKKLQNTLETLKKLSEFSKNITSNKTQRETTGLPIINRTYLTEYMFIESHRNNETQTRDASSQTHRYKTTTLNKHVTSKAPSIESAKFLNTTNNPPKIVTTYIEIDITTKHAKTTTLEPDNKSYKPLQLQMNKDELQNDSRFIQNKKATFDEIKKTLDQFTMERKKIITSTPRHLEIEAHAEKDEEKRVDVTQPDRVKDTVRHWTSAPHLGLIGKVLNENYILLSQQSNKNKITSRLPETIEIQDNNEDIIDAKYISENPEVFNSLRQQTEIMGKLLLNYKKHSARKKNKADNQQSKDNNMKDFEILINKLEEDFQAKSTTNREVFTRNTIKKINNTENSHMHTPKIANSNEKSSNKKIKHSREVSIENKKSSIDLGAREVKPTQHSEEKLTKEIYSNEIATERDDEEISSERDGEEIANEKSSKETSSKETSSNNENIVLQPTSATKNKKHVSRLKKALLRNPDFLKILRFCKSQKRKNKSRKRNF